MGVPALPLHGVRVLDAASGPLQTVGRILSDLGAEVVRLEPPAGSADRTSGAVSGGTSLTFEVRNAGKRSVAIDPADPARTDRLLAGAEIVLIAAPADADEPALLDPARVRDVNPRAVVVSMTDFGADGPMRDWLATPGVHFALSSVLSRSGLPEVPRPLLPPEFLAYQAAAAQAVWVTMLAYFTAVRTGKGDLVDFSVSEALIQILDPGMGIGGSARAGAPMRDLPRGRPDARHLYPIFPAKDGWVRICVLSARQWQGMFRWLGEPAEFADPKFNQIGARFGAARTLYPMIGAMLAGLTREEATQAGQTLGVPVAGLADATEALATDAFWQAGAFQQHTLPDGRTVTVPAGWFEIDGARVGANGAAPTLGADNALLDEIREPAGFGTPDRPALPFSGLRVLDLGVIVVGAELGRLFADYGADVLKIESRAFPDGSRQSYDGSEMTEGFAWGHRNKRSVGVNLKSEEGKQVFRDLVAAADVVLTNFKPGTLDSLGFGFEALSAINPRIVLSESSAFGNTGPWATRLGYGPLVRASAGMSALWRYPEIDGSFSDAITIFPDHVVARLNAAAVTALLLRRTRTGTGGRVSTAQVDTIFGAMADLLALESVQPGTITVSDGRTLDAPRGVFPAAGDDDWVVIDGAGDDRFRCLATAIGRPEWLTDEALQTAAGRLANAERLETEIARWSTGRDATAAAAALQQAGVPAGQMARIGDLLADEHLQARGAFGEMRQPQISDLLPTNLAEARFQSVPAPRLQPAPLVAEHSRSALREILGLDDDALDALVAAGAVEVHPSAETDRHPAPQPA